MNRRTFIRSATAAGCGLLPIAAVQSAQAKPSLRGVIGITTGGLNFQRENRLLTALTLPKFMRDELGMQLIDLNTRWLTSYDETYLNQVLEAARSAGCYFTNLKVNHKFGDLYSPQTEERRRAMSQAQQLIAAAKTLRARWIRFSVPKPSGSGPTRSLAAHRQLADHAQRNGIQLLVENNGWMRSEADALPRLVKAIGSGTAAAPDTGNWDDDVRYDALKQSFPGAVTCDFKVFDLDTDRRHKKYDIRRCFEIGWNAGFRGPWAIEHWNEDTKAFARETVYLRDQLKSWMAAHNQDQPR